MDLGTFYSGRTLLTNKAAKLSTEPDGMFATWDTLLSGRLRLAIGPTEVADGKEVLGWPTHSGNRSTSKSSYGPSPATNRLHRKTAGSTRPSSPIASAWIAGATGLAIGPKLDAIR